MKYKIYIFFILLLSIFLINTKVYAECTYKDEGVVSAYASNVTMGYTVVDEYDGIGAVEGSDEVIENMYSGFHFIIYINNLNDNIYAKVTDDLNNKTINYYYSENNNGNIAIKSTYFDTKVNYKIEIRAKDGNCADKLLRSKTVSTPRFNPFYNYPQCSIHTDFYLCQRFYDFETTPKEFETRFNNYLKVKENKELLENENENSTNFIQNYLYLIISFTVIIVIVLIVLIIKKKRRII